MINRRIKGKKKCPFKNAKKRERRRKKREKEETFKEI